MKAGNRIDASVIFSYQGKEYEPSATVDLDNVMEAMGSFSGIHRMLAKQNNIDTYSYLYEVMEAYEIHYSNPQGIANRCLENGRFDISKFQKLWHEEKVLGLLGSIAMKYLDIEDLEEHADLKAAMIASYDAGKHVEKG